MGISIRAARVNARYTQRKAAEKLDISVSTLANYEKGKTEPDYSIIDNMIKLYGVSFDDLDFCPKIP